MDKYEAGAFDEDAEAAATIQEYEARIAAPERPVGKQALELESLKGVSGYQCKRRRRRHLRRALPTHAMRPTYWYPAATVSSSAPHPPLAQHPGEHAVQHFPVEVDRGENRPAHLRIAVALVRVRLEDPRGRPETAPGPWMPNPWSKCASAIRTSSLYRARPRQALERCAARHDGGHQRHTDPQSTLRPACTHRRATCGDRHPLLPKRQRGWQKIALIPYAPPDYRPGHRQIDHKGCPRVPFTRSTAMSRLTTGRAECARYPAPVFRGWGPVGEKRCRSRHVACSPHRAGAAPTLGRSVERSP